MDREEVPLDEILALPEGLEKTVALVAWFQGIYPPGAGVPVLVGGAAAEILSGGAYTTGDLDFVGEIPPEVAGRLEEAGFSRQGRYWLHEKGQVFVELPASGLGPGERAVSLQVCDRTLLMLSPEDVLVDRLAAWQFWSSQVDGVAAFWIWQSHGERLDLKYLQVTTEHKGLIAALGRLQLFSEQLAGRSPEPEELFSWARTTP